MSNGGYVGQIHGFIRFRLNCDAQFSIIFQQLVDRIQQLYRDKDIYALTGATISSTSVTSGVKAIVKKFAYRVSILDRVLAEQGIEVSF